MDTRLATADDAPAITRLHMRHLPPEMCDLTQLGPRAVERFYVNAIDRELGAVIAAVEHRAVGGYLLVTRDVHTLFTRALISGPLDALSFLASVRPRGLLTAVWKKVSSGTAQIPSVAEAVYLVIGEELRGRGCGMSLMSAGEAWFRSAAVDGYECHVHADNGAVLRLHLGNGMSIKRSYEKGGVRMHVLRKTLMR